MKKESQEQVLKVRMRNIEQDLEMIEAKKERLDMDRDWETHHL